MKKKTIAFIGAGNMASALIAGLIANDYPPNHIFASNPSPKKLNRLKDLYGIHISQNNQEAASAADIIILAAKPLQFVTICQEIKHIIVKNQPLLISVAVGTTLELMQKWFGTSLTAENKEAADFSIIRAIPNIPATVNAGTTGLYANSHVKEEDKNIAESIFRSVGITLWLKNEADLISLCALSGSGPAYVFYFMEAMEAAGINLGLSPEDTKLLTEQTVLGAAKMALESGQSLNYLRQAVTSPQGTTEAAIQVLEHSHFLQNLQQAMTAAADRHYEIIEKLNQLEE